MRASDAVNWLPVMRALLGHWKRHPIQFATLVVGLMVATALWSGVQALNAEARASYARAAAALGGEDVATVVSVGGGRLSLGDYLALRREGWSVAPLLEGTLRRSDGTLRIIGIDPLTVPPEAASLSVGGGTSQLIEFITPPYVALAAPATAAALGQAPDVPRLAESDALPPDTLLVDIAVAERLLDAEGQISRLLLPPEDAEQDLPPALSGHLRVVPPETEPELSRLTDSFHLNLTAFGFLSFVVGLFIVYAAIGLAFEERRGILRTLRACGVPARGLTLALVVELVGIALLAGTLGMAAGYVIAATLLPDVAASLRGLYGARVPGTLSLQPGWWIAGLGVSVCGALAASGLSLWRASTLSVLAPAHPEAWLGSMRRTIRVQTLAAIALAGAAVAAALWGGGLLGGFVLMGTVLLAAALLLPAALGGLLALGARSARGPLGQWIWADGRQQLGGLSLALMALLLALAVNIGVGTMVGSFRQTFSGYLEQRLAPEIYITATDDAQAAALADWLEARPDVEAVLPLWRADSRVAGWPAEVYGFRDHRTYRDSWPLLEAGPDAWDAVARSEAVMISEQLARRASLGLGSAIDIPFGAGTWTTRVAGIYPDYGNTSGQIMVALPELDRRWEDISRLQLGARADPDDVADILADVRAAFPLGERQAVDQASVMAFSRDIFDRTFAITVALNALTLAVAGIALFSSLLTLAGQRLVQVAPLWAMGITRRRLALLEVSRAVALAAGTAILALPLGLVVAWILTEVINVRAFGWRLPIHVFPLDWLRLFGMALGTAVLAALLPAYRLRRAQPIDLIRGFSNER